MEDIKDLIPYKIKDDEGDYCFYSDAPKETIKASIKLLQTLDSYSYDDLKSILNDLGFRYEYHTDDKWVII